MKLISGAALGIALLAPLCVAEKRPITHEDLWLMKRVDAPVPSPDGRHVVFSVAEPAYEESKQVSDLWIVSGDGSGQPRRLTHTKGGESGVTWSLDSRRIAFSARREGDDNTQIYLMDIAQGGEAQRVTTLPSGASSPKFSPDGTSILFQSTVPTVDDKTRSARKYRARVYDTFPIRYWDKWIDEVQRQIFVQALAEGSSPRDLLGGTKLASIAGFGGVATNSGQDLQAVWTPDGSGIVFTGSSNRNEAAFANVRTDLYYVAAGGGEPRLLTSGPSSYSKAVFHPDGKTLYATEDRHRSIYNLDRLVMMPWVQNAAKAPVSVTGDWDRSVASWTFGPDGRSIYLTAEDAGREKLYRTGLESGTPKLLADPKIGCFSGLGGGRQGALFASYDSATAPPELVRIDPSTGSFKPLTSLNTERVAQLDLPPLREFWFTSSKGRQIHNYVALPPNFDESKKYPLFVVIHGGPHSMWRDQWVIRWNYHLLAKPGYIVLLTDYTGSTGYGEKFAQAIVRDPLAGPGQELNEAADYAIKQFPFIDAARQAAGGASYGGHLANWLQASTTRYKCLISHAGLINVESQWGTSDTIYHRELGMGGPHWKGDKIWQEQNPIKYAEKFRTPMLVTVGENDYRVPLNQSLENWSVLQRMKVPSRLVVFPEANHWIMKGEDSRFFYSQVHEWLGKWLGQ